MNPSNSNRSYAEFNTDKGEGWYRVICGTFSNEAGACGASYDYIKIYLQQVFINNKGGILKIELYMNYSDNAKFIVHGVNGGNILKIRLIRKGKDIFIDIYFIENNITKILLEQIFFFENSNLTCIKSPYIVQEIIENELVVTSATMKNL